MFLRKISPDFFKECYCVVRTPSYVLNRFDEIVWSVTILLENVHLSSPRTKNHLEGLTTWRGGTQADTGAYSEAVNASNIESTSSNAVQCFHSQAFLNTAIVTMIKVVATQRVPYWTQGQNATSSQKIFTNCWMYLVRRPIFWFLASVRLTDVQLEKSRLSSRSEFPRILDQWVQSEVLPVKTDRLCSRYPSFQQFHFWKGDAIRKKSTSSNRLRLWVDCVRRNVIIETRCQVR